MVKIKILSIFETIDYTKTPPAPAIAVTFRTEEGLISTVYIPKEEWDPEKPEEVLKKYIEPPHPLVGKELEIR